MTKKKDKKRLDLDVRPHPNPLFKNYDYGGPEDGSKTGPGRGLYNGPMDKYKSTEEFIKNDRKRRRKKRKAALANFVQNADFILAVAAVLDLKKKLEEKKELDEKEKIKQQLLEQSPSESETVPERTDDLERKREEKMQTEIQEQANVWQHRFSQVRKDQEGYFILKADNSAGKQMKPGQLLADVALNMTPYWKITSVKGDRISLAPIAPNPFSTGVGAGGAKLTQYDVDVFTGEAEKRRAGYIQKKLEDGTATIDDVTYILEGTVPVNMGPNGAQGGWYNPGDRSSRGGRKGMKPEEIMMQDAQRLKELGFTIPRKALDGTMDVDVWKDWVGHNGSDVDYFPRNVDKYLDFHKKMTAKNRWKYDDDDLAALRRKLDETALTEHFESIMADFTSMPKEEFKAKHKYYDTLQEIVNSYDYSLRSMKKSKAKLLETMTDVEDESEESILKNIFNPERRIAIKNTILLVEMAKEDEKYVSYLHDMIRLGGSDYFANEKVINFFDLIDDIEGLKMANECLKDPTNKRYALGHLARKGEMDYVVKYTNEHFSELGLEVIGSVLNNLHNELPDESGLGGFSYAKRINFIIDFAKKNNLIDRLKALAYSDDVSQERYYASEIISVLLRSFGPTMSWQPGDEEMVKELSNMSKAIKGG